MFGNALIHMNRQQDYISQYTNKRKYIHIEMELERDIAFYQITFTIYIIPNITSERKGDRENKRYI